ncbi:MAG: hypothetical protein NT094_03475 [Candidatus Staskawiczbacteria bacterium]|nr:hypothetical protein [Candidatus Staskawiczbacteria bacterium]
MAKELLINNSLSRDIGFLECSSLTKWRIQEMLHVDSSVRRLLVKFGTQCLSQAGRLNQEIFDLIAFQIIEAMKFGVEVTIVTSAGILAGVERAREIGLDIALLERKYVAGIGARHLLNMWGAAFEKHGREIAQIWISGSDLENIAEKQSIQFAIRDYHAFGVIPVVNQNDVVDGQETESWGKGGSENDNLSEKLAGNIGADSILFLTDEKGVYEQSFRVKRYYKEIDIATAEKLAEESAGSSQNGSGGMSAKLRAGIKCYRRGMKVCIASLSDDAILKFVRGEKVGTTFGSSTRFW